MTTRPTAVDASFTPPDWAPAESPDVDEPLAAQKTNGWQAGQQPPATEHNWFWKRASDWAKHFATTAARYTTLESGVADALLAPGDSFILDEADESSPPGLVLGSGSAASARDVDVAGDSICTSNNDADLRQMSRDLLTVVQDIGKTGGAGTPVRGKTDGVKAWMAYAQIVEQFDLATGVSDWTFDHGAAVNDIDFDGVNVYLVGDIGTGTHHARALTRAAGAAVWSYDHGGVLESVCTDGRHVFVAGAASSFGSVATMRGLIASNGFDAANEGGTGSDASAWDQAPAATVINRVLACDDARLYWGDATSNTIETRDKALGTVVNTAVATNLNAINIDHEFVYGVTSSNIRAWTKSDLAQRWTTVVPGGPDGLASDGAKVYYARTVGNEVVRLARGNTPGFWKKSATPASAAFQFPRQLAYPFRLL